MYDIKRKIAFMVYDFKTKVEEALGDTEYKDEIVGIVRHYEYFILCAIRDHKINSLEELELFRVDKVIYKEGYAYAIWGNHTLTLNPRFFIERNDEEKRTVLFHELFHAKVNKMMQQSDNELYFNFCRFLDNIEKLLNKDQIDSILSKYKDIFNDKKLKFVVSDVLQSFNEITTQYLAESLSMLSYDKKKREKTTFESKIFNQEYFLSNFSIYPEYQQIFFNFLRTINGFGNIDDDDLLFDKWLSMLEKGTIWNQIVCTYQEKGNMELLFDFLISYGALRIAKESSMGINVSYQGDKEVLTNSLIELDNKLIKARNYDDEHTYDYQKFDWQNKNEGVIRITPRR